MRVLGTAGHVDHGKSTLIGALTGTHPDRLKEEREREMTIELGFAHLDLPGVGQVGIVDVPGHRDFIENMLAGVGGIDAALLVVAADEGVMPQTREHLAILDLLQIRGGVIALTKCDLAPDADWQQLVIEDLRGVVSGTVLAGAPVIPVSARSGAGLDALKSALSACLAASPARRDLGRPRLPVDRAFSMTGFGSVVTGTLIDGCLRVGEDVVLLPDGVSGRVRGLQAFGNKEDQADPGSRTAVNLSGVEIADIRRGMVLARPRQYLPTRRFDAWFRVLPDAGMSVRHDDEVKVFSGASETLARVRLLGGDELLPGQTGWLQLELREALVVVRGDRFILRCPSPSRTLGGGEVLDPAPAGRHRRFVHAVLERLEVLRAGDPADMILQALRGGRPAPLAEVRRKSGLQPAQFSDLLPRLLAEGRLIQLEPGDPQATADLLVMTAEDWRALGSGILKALEQFHRANPLRAWMGREELRTRLELSARALNAALVKLGREGSLVDHDGRVRLAAHDVRFTPEQQNRAERLLARFASAPFASPSLREAQAEAGEALVLALVETGRLVQVSAEVLFRSEDYDRLVNIVREHFHRQPTLSVSELRDQIGSSRKYVLALLEHLDKTGMTIREGETRRLRRPNA